MRKFSEQEVEAEHRRRRTLNRRETDDQQRDVCIHCGHPLSYRLPPGQEAGLCDSCESQDD